MSKEQIVAAIDIGSSKICTLVGDLGAGPNIQIQGVGVVQARGLRRGVIVDLEEATTAIRDSLVKAERSSGFSIKSAHVSVGGTHIAATNNKGMIAIGGGNHIIDLSDMERAIESARTTNLPNTREIITVVARRFTLDGQEGIRNPRGMHGTRLEVDAHIVTGSVSALQNLTRCVERAGIAVDSLILQPVASAEAVLSEEEKEMGVAVIDIGGGTTDIAIYEDGNVVHSACLPFSGYHLTNDIAIYLRTPFAVADDLKARYGQASARDIDPTETVEIKGFGNGTPRLVLRQALCEIIAARVEEIFLNVRKEIEQSPYRGSLPAGVVLTGGTAQLHGITEAAEELLGVPARVGRPKGIYGLIDSVNSPAFAASHGMLLWTRKTLRPAAAAEHRGAHRESRRINLGFGAMPNRIFRLAQELLP